MLLTISSSEPVSTGCLLLTVFMQQPLHYHFHHHITGFRMLILTSQSLQKFSKMDASSKPQKDAMMQNLQSSKTKVQRQHNVQRKILHQHESYLQQMNENKGSKYEMSKMYEHAGKAYIHWRDRSKRGRQLHHMITTISTKNKEQRTMNLLSIHFEDVQSYESQSLKTMMKTSKQP